MGLFKDAFVLSSANTILGEFFDSAQSLRDIAGILSSQQAAAVLKEHGADINEVLGRLDRPDIPGIDVFESYRQDANYDLYEMNLRNNAIGCDDSKSKRTYSELMPMAAAMGINAAAYMPRIMTGSIVGTPKMMVSAFRDLRAAIQRRLNEAAKDINKAMLWRIKGVMILSESEEDAKVKMLKEIRMMRMTKSEAGEIVLTEEYDMALTVLVKNLGYKKKEAMQVLVEMMLQDPDMTTDEIILRIVRGK